MPKVKTKVKGGLDYPVGPTKMDLLRSLTQQVNKGLGNKGKLAMGNDAFLGTVKGFIPTGSYMLDLLLNGGVAIGRVFELYGKPSVGKSTLSMSIMAQVQRMGGQAFLLDSERTYTADRAEALGIDVDTLVQLDADTLEGGFQALQKTLEIVQNTPELVDKPSIFVWDTITMAPTEASAEGMYAGGQSERPRVIKYYMPMLAKALATSNAALIVVNQLMSGPKGNDTPGGHALHHITSQRVELWAGNLKSSSDELDERQGIACHAVIKKNKISGLVRDFTVEFPVYRATGIDSDLSVVDYLADAGVPEVKKGGGWITINFKGEPIKMRAKEVRNVCDEVEGLREFLQELAKKRFTIDSTLAPELVVEDPIDED